MTQRCIAYVDSAEEQVAFLISRFGPHGSWSVTEQRMVTDSSGTSVERTRLATSDGPVEVEFRDPHPDVVITDKVEERDRASVLDAVMERASRFAAENPPHHPGSLPRFPVPIEHYDQAVAVPLPILAVDDRGRRGLFAPPRMAVVSWATIEPVGVREFDVFDPNAWPPPRLGDWPAPSVIDLASEVLEAYIQRFSACWSRTIDAWIATNGATSDFTMSLRSDVQDALRLRAVLDVPAMEDVYRSMNSRFTQWLQMVGA